MKGRQLVIAAVVVFFVLFTGAKIYASNVAEEKLDQFISDLSKFGNLTYESVSVDLIGQGIQISDVVISPINFAHKITINEISIGEIDQDSEIPLFLDIDFNGIEVNFDELGSDAKNLIALGYEDNLLVNISASYEYDQQDKEIKINKLQLGADDLGNLDISMKIGNIALDWQTILSNHLEATLDEAKISYEDDSLMVRLIEKMAQDKNEDIDDYKQQAFKLLDSEIARAKDEFTKGAISELKDFIDDPEQFSISINPNEPWALGNFMRIRDPQAYIKTLNVKVDSQ